MIPAWRNPGVSLGLRCVEWCREQMRLGVHASAYPGPNTSPQIAEWLGACLRDTDNDGDLEPLGITAGNWCAAFQSAALEACLLEGEERPHHRRAGVVEIVADARGRGLWHDVEEVRLGLWSPALGDLVIWDRSDPTRPETSWHRHVNRLVSWTSLEQEQFRTIGGNEGRGIRETVFAPKGLDASRLLGFVSYYQASSPTEVDEETRAQDAADIAAFIEAHRREVAAGLDWGKP